MIQRWRAGAGLVGILFLAWHTTNVAPCPAQEKGSDAGHLAYLLQRQQAYALVRVSDQRRVSLETKPVFRWYNPISGARGGVFVWTVDGRPVAMTKCHVNDRKQHYVESSVAFSAGLLLKYQDQMIWKPREPALKDVPVKDSMNPAPSSARRLLQMRQLAAGFSIEDQWGEDAEPYQLRLMPRPLYRYASKESGVLDGAVFAFAQGTNPEAVVIVEAVQQDNGSAQQDGEAVQQANAVRWRCGISRLTGYALQAERDGATVYRVNKLNHPGLGESYRHHWEQPKPYPFQVEEASKD